MFKSLRRGSRSTTSRIDSEFATRPNRSGTNFFDLPGEIRNRIYELVAQSTSLRLLHWKKRKTTAKDLVTVPALFLTSRRCRQEYLPILLSTAYIEAFIVNFDFRNVMRAIGSLYSSELKALRRNRQLVLLLLLPTSSSGTPSKDELAHLRRWTTYRADAPDRLPWNYHLAPASADGQSAACRDQCYQHIAELSCSLTEPLQWELQRILDVVREAG